MTIKQFARAIGVSPATVSRAIHGRGRINPATRQMVLRRMEELDYTPNIHAQRLVERRTSMAALDFRGIPPLLGDPYFAELAHGVQEGLQAHNYGLLLSSPGEALGRWVRSRAVDGVILVGGEPADYQAAREIAATGAVCVIVGHQAVEGVPKLGSVVVGLEAGARQAARMLAEQGHRRIGFLGTRPEDAVLSAFRDELAKHGVELRPELTVMAGRTIEDGALGMTRLLAAPERPTAVFARRDTLAVGALRAAARHGVRVPEEISLVGHDDISLAQLVEPTLTTVRVDRTSLGRSAAELLLSLLNGGEPVQPPRVIATDLVVRESVAPAAR
jgi:DNA-binding LacI/PurR family transcriptional regulator